MPEDQERSPIRFWIYGILALIIMASLLFAMAEFFKPHSEKSETASSQGVEDGRMLRPM